MFLLQKTSRKEKPVPILGTDIQGFLANLWPFAAKHFVTCPSCGLTAISKREEAK